MMLSPQSVMFLVRHALQAVEALGAGEILLNCIDKDGTNSGFEIDLVEAVSKAVSIPVIASSGAGKPEHFTEVFDKVNGCPNGKIQRALFRDWSSEMAL